MGKGFFCIEGLWEEENLKLRPTVLPSLEILERKEKCEYIYHDCATREELIYFIKRWIHYQTSYPVLYLAFHGNKRRIDININDREYFTLTDLADVLENKCDKSVIFFGSCNTLNIPGAEIQDFLKRTNALAALGYKENVDWVVSTAFEMLVLYALHKYPFDSWGMKSIKRYILTQFGDLHTEVKFRMETNKDIYIKRERKLVKQEKG